jgi:hypothetical protein
LLQSRDDVHPFSEKVSVVENNVANVHSDTEADAALWCEAGVRFGQSSLGVDRALHGVHSAAEFRKDTVARRVRYTAPVFPYEPVEDRAPLGQALERADLISAHETTIALNICCEDCDEASADFRRV